jgi:hypothetical protein
MMRKKPTDVFAGGLPSQFLPRIGQELQERFMEADVNRHLSASIAG